MRSRTRLTRQSQMLGSQVYSTPTLGLLGAIFAWGQNNGYVEQNPVQGVKPFADAQKKAMLTGEQSSAGADT